MSFNSRFKNAVRGIRSLEPARTEVQQAVELLAPAAGRRSLRLARICALAVAGGTVASGVLLFPSRASALDSMTQALKSVPTSHSRNFRTDGKPVMEFWREGVKRRYAVTGSEKGESNFVRAFDGKNVWSIGHNPRSARIAEESPFGFGHEGTSVDEQIQNWIREGVTGMSVKVKRVQIGGTTFEEMTVDGATAKTGDAFRHVFVCRLKDHLPVTVRFQRVVNGKPVLISHSEIDYPSDLPDSLFEFDPPKGYPVYDLRIAKRQMEVALAGNGPAQTVAGQEIRLLGAFEDARGSVFILWSGGATPNIDAKARVLDASGTPASLTLPSRDEKSYDQRVRENKGSRDIPRLGETDRDPYEILPLAVAKGVRIFGLGAKLAPSPGQTIKVAIPVFKEGARRIVRLGEKGAYFASNGYQVGTAEFETKTVAVDFFFNFMEGFDSRGPSSWSNIPLGGGD